MQLFEAFTRTDDRPATHTEDTFSFLQRSAWLSTARVRSVLETWFSHLPGGERRPMRRRFMTDFDVAFFELTLHEMLLRLGSQVECHPKLDGTANRPDYLAAFPGGEVVVVEAVLATDESADAATRRARQDHVYDQINKIESPDFFLEVRELDDPGGSQPVGRRIRAFLDRELPRFDPDEATRLYEDAGFDALPNLEYRDGNFRVHFVLIPKSVRARGKPGRAIGMYPMVGGWIDTAGALRTAVNRKATRYGMPGRPFVIAVNSTSRWGIDRIDMMQALYGTEAFTFGPGLAEPVMSRKPDGAWFGPSGPQNTRVSAVIFCSLFPFGLPKCDLMLLPNPWAAHPIDPKVWGMPYADPGVRQVQWRPGHTPGELLGLPKDWPEVGDESLAI